jgi:DNA ligase (NAD+)
MNALSRIAQLRSAILKAKQAYYYRGDSLFTDREYDTLEDELRQLSPDDPVLKLVGAPIPPDSMLTKASHRIPMGSQSKVNSIDEFRIWHEKSEHAILHGSLKGDGASAAAYYENGHLKQCISRGDGSVGEDVTANALKFKGLPAYVADGDRPFNGAVRIEVILTVADWGVVDPARSKNPRNAGTGIMGRKNGHQAELLTVFAFDLDEEGRQFTTETEKTERLAELGFNVIQHLACATSDDAIAFFEQTVKQRDDLPIWIDGVVLKLNDIAAQRAMGSTGGRPKGQIAWKFDSSGAETTLVGVNVSGGHTGALIPNAELTPVEIGGTTVKSASLANYGEVERLGLAVGDRVWVIKANDIIPKVVRVTEQGPSRQPIVPPSQCPFCGGSVGRRKNTGGDEGVVIECQNEDCPKKSIGKIKRWITSVDIQGIGDSVRLALVEQLELEDAADLYWLRTKKEALAELVINQDKDIRLGEKRATTILEGIEARRELTLPAFLGSLGIDRLGKRRVELMMQAAPGELDTVEQWRSGKLRQPEFAEKAGVPNTGAAIQDGLDAMASLIDRLLAAGVVVVQGAPAAMPQGGADAPTKTVCITGKLPSGKKKSDYAAALEAAGYRLVDTVEAGLDFLVLAEPNSTSSKAQKARKLNVALISEEDLERML